MPDLTPTDQQRVEDLGNHMKSWEVPQLISYINSIRDRGLRYRDATTDEERAALRAQGIEPPELWEYGAAIYATKILRLGAARIEGKAPAKTKPGPASLGDFF